MTDGEKKIIVDDDWKAEAKAEKERLSEQEQKAQAEPLPPAALPEMINLLAMQAMAGLGMVAGPGGERIPPSPEVAKHFIDLLQVLEEKTKGNVTDEETALLGQVLYDLRMRYVQMLSGGAGPAAVGGVVPPTS